MKKEIAIQVSRGAFGKPLYHVSVYNTEKLANLHRYYCIYWLEGESLPDIFRLMRQDGHGDVLEQLSDSVRASAPGYHRNVTLEMQRLRDEFCDHWFAEHTHLPIYADAIEWARKQTVREACEWLRKTHYIYTESHWCLDEDSMNETPWVTNDFDTVEELIDEFNKAMGE